MTNEEKDESQLGLEYNFLLPMSPSQFVLKILNARFELAVSTQGHEVSLNHYREFSSRHGNFMGLALHLSL